MKISIQNLKVLIENFLRENPYDDKEKSKKFDAELEKAEKELEREKLAGHRSTKRRKQGMKMPPNIFNAIAELYRNMMEYLLSVKKKKKFVAAAGDKTLSEPELTNLEEDILSLYVASKDIGKGNQADALKKFKELSDITVEIIKSESRAQADFDVVQNAVKDYLKRGRAAADKEDSENFLLGLTQDEIKAKEAEEKAAGEGGKMVAKTLGDLDKKTKDSLSKDSLKGVLGGTSKALEEEENRKTIKEIQKLIKAPSSKDGSQLGDGQWGPGTFKAWQGFLKEYRESIMAYNLEEGKEKADLEAAVDDILASDYDPNDELYGKSSFWGYLQIKVLLSKNARDILGDGYPGMKKFIEEEIKYVKEQNEKEQNEKETIIEIKKELGFKTNIKDVWTKTSNKKWLKFLKDNKEIIKKSDLFPEEINAGGQQKQSREATLGSILNAAEIEGRVEEFDPENKNTLWGYLDFQTYMTDEAKQKMTRNYSGMLEFIKNINAAAKTKAIEKTKYISDWENRRPTVQKMRKIVDKLHKRYPSYYDGSATLSTNSDVAMKALYEEPGIYIGFVRTFEEFKKIHSGKSFEDFIQDNVRMDDPEKRKEYISGMGDEAVQYATSTHKTSRMTTDIFFDQNKGVVLIDSMGGDYIEKNVKLTDDGEFIKVGGGKGAGGDGI